MSEKSADFPKRSTGFLSNQLARGFSQALAQSIAPLGLAPAQFMVLSELWRGDGLTQHELSRKLDVEQATMANTLARMVRDGLVVRSPHPSDRRATLIHLTQKATALKKPAKAAAREVNARALGDLSKKEQDRFVESLHRVIAALKGAPASPSVVGEDRLRPPGS